MSATLLFKETPAARIFVELPGWHPLSYAVAETPGLTIEGVRSIHVGQGDCNALVGKDSHGSEVEVIYFDMGGGCGRCAKTFPTAADHGPLELRIRFGKNPKVILSHWDKDHYYSGSLLPASECLEWLVPRQWVSPHALRFANQISEIYCFPTTDNALRFDLTSNSYLQIERVQGANAEAAGSDKNLCGLACTLVRVDRATGTEQRIVMPGDAPYQFIPSLAAEEKPASPITCLFAFHHGSRTHLTGKTHRVHIPRNARQHTIAFTYGLAPSGDDVDSNPFGHPDPKALEFYDGKCWKRRVNTASELPDTTAVHTAGHDRTTGGDRSVWFAD